ncbi:MAG: ATP-binding protein, partial [Ginsengibacter sp.]
RVFNKFYRVEETSHRFQGLGLGLFICENVINGHNGTIGVTSKLGEGSEFYFYIPIHPPEEEK